MPIGREPNARRTLGEAVNGPARPHSPPTTLLVEQKRCARPLISALGRIPAGLLARNVRCVSLRSGPGSSNRGPFERLSAWLEGPRQRGQILAGGQAIPRACRIAPTLLGRCDQADDSSDGRHCSGLTPVLSCSPRWAAAIARINDRPQPLALYLFSPKPLGQETLLAAPSFGGVCFNDVVMQVGVPDTAVGGRGAAHGNYPRQAGFDTFSHHSQRAQTPFRFDLRSAIRPTAATCLA